MRPRLRRGARRTDGGVRLTIAAVERDVLAGLPEQLRAIVAGDAEGGLADEIRARLFPRAHSDPQLEAEYRELVGNDLAEQRLETLERFLGSLDEGETTGGTWRVELTTEQAEAWLSVANDARLAFAEVVGIRTEADWERGPDPEDPASALLFYLGWLEEELVTALSGPLQS